MTRVHLKVHGITTTPDPDQFSVRFDVVAEQEDGSTIVLATTDNALLRVGPDLASSVSTLFAELGRAMEQAAGLDPAPDASIEEEAEDEQEL